MRRHQDLHGQAIRKPRAPAERGALGQKRSAERECGEKRHDADHDVERGGALLARHELRRTTAHTRAAVLSSTSRPSTRRMSRALVLSIRARSWVAIKTVVPKRLSSAKRRIR